MNKEMEERAIVLLKAMKDFLVNVDDNYNDAMSLTTYYDEAFCDGYCLLDDIEALLDGLLSDGVINDIN